jgi:predicted phosphodiesterase
MHGNAVAFRAALADVQTRGVDLIVSLGDVAQGGPQPRECVELLRELDCPCVFGNSDNFLLTLDLGAEPIEDEEQRQRLMDTLHWSRGQLGDDGLAFLESFQPTVEVGDLLCCHATPRSNEEVILPATPPDEAEAALAGVSAAAVAAGHVHQQWLRRFDETLWFSVGSVGLVWELLDEATFLPWSEYAIVDDELRVEFRRLSFDVEKLIEAARATDFPYLDRWVAQWRR